MGKLRPGHIVEASLWLGLSLFLYIYSFEFDKEIEIYKYGASAWPRAIILLIVIASIGQLLYHYKVGDGGSSGKMGDAADDGSQDIANESGHTGLGWYLSTFGLLAIPFAYILVPGWIAGALSIEGTGVHIIKIISAAILLAIFIYYLRSNLVGGILALPVFFAAMLQDMGFYALAPFFILGVMFLMGERRIKPMIQIMLLIYAILLGLFVSLLYVGLPTGYIHPFYDFGTWIVTILQ